MLRMFRCFSSIYLEALGGFGLVLFKGLCTHFDFFLLKYI